MKQYHIVSRVAIYLLSVVLFAFGVFHFLHPRDLLLFLPEFLPGGIIWVYLVGAAFILVALSFFINKMVKLAAYLLAGLLVIFILTIHLPNYVNANNPESKQMALINLLKDTAIVGFALHIAAGAHHQRLHMEDSD
jgi:putative oxidoreductase